MSQTKEHTSAFEQYKKDIPVLVELGFIAIKQFDILRAGEIFKAVAALDPKSSAPHLGYGYISLQKLELDAAKKHYKKALELDPKHEVAHTMLGIAHILGKPAEERAEGKRILTETLKTVKDLSAKELCERFLKWANSQENQKGMLG